MIIKQFAITLFNLQLWGKDKSSAPTRTPEWLAQRFALFEKYTLPSMNGQTCRDFTWLCLFDKDSANELVSNKIEEYKKANSRFTPLFFGKDEAEELAGSLYKAISERFLSVNSAAEASGALYVLTTNIDNDDAIHCSMLQKVRERAESELAQNGEKALGLYSCIYGLQYFVKRRLAVRMKYPDNHFQSLLERAEGFKTIKGFSHTKVRKLFDNHDIIERGTAYWLEVVHSRNVNNSYRINAHIKNISVWGRLSLSDFGLGETLSTFNNTLKALFTVPALFIEAAVRGAVRHIRK